MLYSSQACFKSSRACADSCWSAAFSAGWYSFRYLVDPGTASGSIRAIAVLM